MEGNRFAGIHKKKKKKGETEREREREIERLSEWREERQAATGHAMTERSSHCLSPFRRGLTTSSLLARASSRGTRTDFRFPNSDL